MAESGGAHILVFPYPAQGHMMPLLDLTHQLVIRGLTITILVTPKNLPLLNPLLSKNPSIQTLVLPFPANPSIPAGVENVKELPAHGFLPMIRTLSELRSPITQWFRNHPSPPVAILSDMFLGWTHRLAEELGIRRFNFSPSGAMSMAIVYNLWRDMPKRLDPTDPDFPISFPDIPSCPTFPWWQISPIYRSYIEGDPLWDTIKEWFLANIASWGLVINSFSELERAFLDYLMKKMGHNRVWAVGPLLPPPEEALERAGSSSDLAAKILSWLDTCHDHSVVFVCFGSQAVLTNKQLEALALGLEKSGAKFILSTKEPTLGHMAGEYGAIPEGFEDRVAGRGLVVRGWVPQVSILKHRATGAFLTHCGWNSLLESLVAGVPMLTWPMGADQFVDATLLVDELKMAIRVCEGEETVPDSNELARLVAKALSDENNLERARATRLREAALAAIKEGGSSFKDLDGFVEHIMLFVQKDVRK